MLVGREGSAQFNLTHVQSAKTRTRNTADSFSLHQPDARHYPGVGNSDTHFQKSFPNTFDNTAGAFAGRPKSRLFDHRLRRPSDFGRHQCIRL